MAGPIFFIALGFFALGSGRQVLVAKFSNEVQHRYATELQWESTMISSILTSVTRFIVRAKPIRLFRRLAV